MVPPYSDRISRVPPYSNPVKLLPLLAYHHLWSSFPSASGYFLTGIGLVRVRSPLLTESRLISFPPATEMFHFAGFASKILYIQIKDNLSLMMLRTSKRTYYQKLKLGFPIRTSTDQSLLAAPRGLSQLATSFIACTCLGIHRYTFKTLDNYVAFGDKYITIFISQIAQHKN